MLTSETQRQFVALLATLYPDRASIVRIAQSAGMRVELVALESSAVDS